ncbi:hypothetical protein Rs2_14050 [Raphanus sativus]|nr:hypothetical protein Rs2_14050 [Raphanus sativus]
MRELGLSLAATSAYLWVPPAFFKKNLTNGLNKWAKTKGVGLLIYGVLCFVETRCSSSISKRFCTSSSSLPEPSSSSPRPTRRSKVKIDAVIESAATAEPVGSSSVSEIPV